MRAKLNIKIDKMIMDEIVKKMPIKKINEIIK
jgi:hypothetical protein